MTGAACLPGLAAVALLLPAVAEVLARVWALVTTPVPTQDGCATAFLTVCVHALTTGEMTARGLPRGDRAIELGLLPEALIAGL